MPELTGHAKAIHAYFLKTLPEHIIVQGKAYPKPLAEELVPWHLYVVDQGHCIICGVSSLYERERTDEEHTEYLVAIPVKTVLRWGYSMADEGYPIADVPYSSRVGVTGTLNTEYEYE